MKKISVFLIFVIVIASIAGVVFYQIFGFDRYFSPSPERIVFEVGKIPAFDLPVSKSCTYEVGFQFQSKDSNHQVINDVFGDKATKLNFPARIDIEIVNSKQEIVFEKTDFGGRNLSYRYGPSPRKFIAGNSYLSTGNYLVNIDIKRVDMDTSSLDSYFYAEIPPKIKCKKNK